MILEVERLDEECDNLEQRQSRMDFYKRNGLPKQIDFTNVSKNYENGTEIGNSLEFDFVVPPPHS